MKKADVYVRELGKTVSVPISSEDKPEIHQEFIDKWHSILNLLSKVLKVPSGLIMHVTEDVMEVKLKSSNSENPYEINGSDQLGHGLYCETVIGLDSELVVENALNSEVWKDNPDVKLNMISYYGLPIKWPDGEFYGTLCILDDSENIYSEDFKLIMREFRKSIEKDLEIMCLNKELRFYSEVDSLTGVYNRRYCDKAMANEFERSKRSGHPYSVIIFDLDQFKLINDTMGHDMGDCVLKTFSSTLLNRVRSVDILGRYGGDEFVLICPDTSVEGAKALIESVKNDVIEKMQELISFADFSYGIAGFEKYDKDYEGVTKRADEHMYQHKKSKRQD